MIRLLIRRCLTASCLFAVTAGAPLASQKPTTQPTAKAKAPAQQSATATPPVLDALAQATLKKWQELQLQAGPAGLQRVAFEIDVRSRGGMTGSWKATGKFEFDASGAAPHGKLTWEDAEITDALTRRGWTAKVFARDFQPAPALSQLAGAKVQGRTTPKGTILTILGGEHKEETFWLFDRAGVKVGTVVGPLRMKNSYQVIEVDKSPRYLRSGGSFSVQEATGEVTIWNRERLGVWVPIKIHEVVKVQGKVLSDLTFVFRNHKVPPKPTSRPASKPTKPSKK